MSGLRSPTPVAARLLATYRRWKCSRPLIAEKTEDNDGNVRSLLDSTLIVLAFVWALSQIFLTSFEVVPIVLVHELWAFGSIIVFLSALCLLGIIRRRDRVRIAVLASILFLVAQVFWNLGYFQERQLFESRAWILGGGGIGLGLAVVAMPLTRAILYVVLDSLFLAVVPIIPHAPERAWNESILDGVLHLSLGMIIAVSVFVLRTSADAQLEAYQRRAATYHSLALARQLEATEPSFSRMVHDHVLSVLHQASLEDPHFSPEELGKQAGSALEKWEQALTSLQDEAHEPVELNRLVEMLRIQTELLGARLEIDLDAADGPWVKTSVAEAIVEATGEALRNARLHAGRGALEISAKISSISIIVRITDSGPGFDPLAIPANRLGIRNSIVGRLHSIGGQVEFSQADSGGSCVRLSWQESGAD